VPEAVEDALQRKECVRRLQNKGVIMAAIPWLTVNWGTIELQTFLSKTRGDAVNKRVSAQWGIENLKGQEMTRFVDNRGDTYVVVLLDEPYAFTNSAGRLVYMSFITSRADSVSEYFLEGVTLAFPVVRWSFNGEWREFRISENAARGFAAMAQFDKIQAIKCFRESFREDGVTPGLKTSKDIIEAFQREF
jgi:hypothetical protein